MQKNKAILDDYKRAFVDQFQHFAWLTLEDLRIAEIGDVKDCQGDHELQLDASLVEESERDRNKERPSD